MHSETAFVLTLAVFCYAVVSNVVRRSYFAPALIFVVAGLVLGSAVLGLITVDPDAQSFTILAQLALTVILFNQASRIDLGALLKGRRVSLRLLLIGIPITVGLGTVTALLLLPELPVWEAVCLAVVVAPTEVALIDALLEDHRIPQSVRHALSVESGFYDGFALAALFAAMALASLQVDNTASRWAWFAFRMEFVSVAVGLVVGLIGAVVVTRSRARGWMSDTWAQLATLALGLACFGVGERLHASGFVAAFVGGLTYSIVSSKAGSRIAMEVSDSAGQLLELLVFAVFGAFAVITAWRDTDWRVVVFALVTLFAVRVVAVAVALMGTGMSAVSTLFIGWFGPRGIGTLVLGLLVIETGNIGHESLIIQATVIAVTISLVLHSVTAPLGIRLCHRYERSENLMRR